MLQGRYLPLSRKAWVHDRYLHVHIRTLSIPSRHADDHDVLTTESESPGYQSILYIYVPLKFVGDRCAPTSLTDMPSYAITGASRGLGVSPWFMGQSPTSRQPHGCRSPLAGLCQSPKQQSI